MSAIAATATVDAAAAPVVEARTVTKRFGPHTALADVDLCVRPGESHALVGRNGAGKSTLVSILTGLRKPDAGVVRFGNEDAPPLADRDGWRARVACVYQHSTIIRELTVAENLFINRQPTKRGAIDWRALRRDARALLDHWRIDVGEDARAGDLTVEARQLVEIARALSYGARFIILDEPTAQLDGDEIKRLFARIRELQREGVTFLFISHHLQEVYDICQAVTVLRDARHIVSAPVAALPRDALIEAMTGERGGLAVADAACRPPLPDDSPPALEVDRLAGGDYEGVSFHVRRGEVVGLAGATSSGRTSVAEAVAGLRAPRAGAIRVDGAALPSGDVPAALARGVGCVPKDRHREGLVLGESVAENASMTIAGALGRFGLAPPAKKRAFGARMIDALGIVAQGPQQPVSGLSGGNQQKVVMARALANDPRVLVLIDPTAGVDVKSKEALLAVVERVRDDGKAVLVASGELDDLRTCDRVLVMFRGRIVAAFPAGWQDNELIAAIEGVDAHEV
ncbi:sugar ABC transporter ATP-binding protein [Burkholderia oklahomensis]|uniref:sugar ABC transporter ATP-binding protein n=2 Tax=Burkholderia oklahomensis TaxID=342113 RepID=UPI0005D7D62A|nr:sugar ABC transporter ATP-binding protein [Burkholderia oklahomensis]AJX35673.1 ABC transporter family protein [Burkholderia oklahomensis C6786]AOI49314.1 multidrug ABC transporter ATP-binding protein [Burkholderia oklahomensis C6786]KUY60639.1 multidrug ABC transporter ATP-binding protein [Burkholderia oklahomensis C6786]MBI0362435.1 sugar ABC transporter ATP-binding protein [Burkholderia oklahomensis]SUY26544.1 Ribose import ATP-binding protein RbsA [Burkholderia oklahomensis]